MKLHDGSNKLAKTVTFHLVHICKPRYPWQKNCASWDSTVSNRTRVRTIRLLLSRPFIRNKTMIHREVEVWAGVVKQVRLCQKDRNVTALDNFSLHFVRSVILIYLRSFQFGTTLSLELVIRIDCISILTLQPGINGKIYRLNGTGRPNYSPRHKCRTNI